MSELNQRRARLRADLEALCSDSCAGRSAGSAGGRAARKLVADALHNAGLNPMEQPVPACAGANVIGHVPGTTSRWMLVAAHYDHLGAHHGKLYRGADDNAAAVTLLLELARSLSARPPEGDGVVLALFDGEEPPHLFAGSRQYALQPTVPLAQLDLMVCMDLLGHGLGFSNAPPAVRESVFVLGAELSDGTGVLVENIARSERGVIARRVNADIVPPVSDYWPFWERQVPFVFLTCARWRHYHTPEDTPEKLEDDLLEARARWLERLTRAACARSDRPVRFQPDGRDDAATIRALRELSSSFEDVSPLAAQACVAADRLLEECDMHGLLPRQRRRAIQKLANALEEGLA